jgi:transcriptional regulator with XRE-family HTH domain
MRRLRAERGLTQQELAQACRVTVRAVQQWESGTRSPRSDTLYGPLAAALGSEVVLRFEAEWRTRAAERMVG